MGTNCVDFKLIKEHVSMEMVIGHYFGSSQTGGVSS